MRRKIYNVMKDLVKNILMLCISVKYYKLELEV